MHTTLTLNPSLDRTFHIERLERGAVMRARSVSSEPAGKGVNVSRALHANGVRSVVVIPVGGSDGLALRAMLETAGLTVVAVPIAGSVRANITVVEDDGTVTKLNEPGPELSSAELDLVVARALEGVGNGDWLVASGSLPPGVPDDVYGSLAAPARSSGARVAVDAGGAPLRAAVEAGVDLVKPNVDEAQAWAGHAIETVGAAVDVACAIIDRGVGAVLLSMGEAGALVVTGDVVVHGWAPVDVARNTVGAGDALLAGYLAGGDDPVEALRMGLTWARAAVRSPLTAMAAPGPDDEAAVAIHPTVDRATSIVRGPDVS